jgi:hypothetical protein
MDDLTSIRLNWTAEEWELYERQNVALRLETVEKLVDVLALFVSGARLSEPEREKWKPLLSALQRRVAVEVKNIGGSSEHS